MTRPTTPRQLALAALDALERREGYADAALDGLLGRHPELAPRDRALVSQLVYGVLRWRGRLDAHLARAASRPLAKIHARLLQVLRLGAYQLLYLDRIGRHAAVHETVELARASKLGHTTGFVNAVLRRVADAGPDLPLPEDPAERLALTYSCPGWLTAQWLAEHGPEGAEALCRSAATVPPLWLRVDRGRDEALAELRAGGWAAEAGAFAPEAVWAGASAGDPRAIPLVARGAAVVQDQASQLVAHLVAPGPGARVLDACAAPGLKATHLVALEPSCRITALDVHPHRVRRIEELAARLGLSGVTAEAADARGYRAAEPFDAVLVDAPCSGLGVLGRTPEAKWRRGPEELAAFPPLQLALLANLADAVRPGGLLVYSTCTTVRAENQAVVEALLADRPDFTLEPPPPGRLSWDGLVTPAGYLCTFGRAGGEGPRALDGFFGARLRRRPG